jgi:hypothetical protein
LRKRGGWGRRRGGGHSYCESKKIHCPNPDVHSQMNTEQKTAASRQLIRDSA